MSMQPLDFRKRIKVAPPVLLNLKPQGFCLSAVPLSKQDSLSVREVGGILYILKDNKK